MDCFAVSLTFGTTRKLEWKDILRMALFFGVFQGAMPVVGWLAGRSIQLLIEPVDHWIAFAILAFIGLKMMWQSFSHDDAGRRLDIRNMSVLLTLSFATSMDALITGFGFGFIKANIYMAVIFIFTVTFIISVIGAKLGGQNTAIPVRWAEFAGGLILVAIGTKIVLEHLALI